MSFSLNLEPPYFLDSLAMNLTSERFDVPREILDGIVWDSCLSIHL